MDKDDIVSTLNDLIQTCKDGEQGFRTCAEQVKDSTLKSYLNNRAQSCAASATELQTQVLLYGEEAETSSSFSGALHRGWVNIKAMISGSDDEAVLDECERGEDVALNAYREALQKDLPANIRSIVLRQYEGVQKNHEEVRALRNREHMAHH